MAGERHAARDRAIWDAYCSGRTQPAIAAEFGLSNQRISQIIATFRDALPPEDKAERVQRALSQLDWIAAQLAEIASEPAIPAYSNGRPILMVDPDTGEEKSAMDHSGRVLAMREIRATQESMRKLLGFDAKVETSVTVETSPEMAALVAQARARRAARDAG